MPKAANQSWPTGMASHLLALHHAARLDLRARHFADGASPEQIKELGLPGRVLFEALFAASHLVTWRCRNVKRPTQDLEGLHQPKVLEVTNRRLVIIPIERPQKLPSGWRPERWLIIDLRLLAAESHPGFHLLCPLCGRIHLFEAKDLRKLIGTPMTDPGEPAPSTPPFQYPSAEHAAFIELWGPYSDLTEELERDSPELYPYLTPRRLELLRETLAEHPGVPVYPSLLGGPAIRTFDQPDRVRLMTGISPHDPTQRIWERAEPTSGNTHST